MSNSGEGTPAGGTTILCLSFNQDASCLALGTRSGYRIIQCSPFSTAFSSESGGVGCCEMLHCTSLLALVGGGDRPAFSPRQLRLVNTKTAKVMLEANFVTAVLAVRMSRKRVVVCLATAIHIFDLETRICLQMLETSPNAEGVIAMSDSDPGSSRGACTIAFPGGLGEVILLDGDTLKVLNKVAACRSSVVALAFSLDGTLLAVASEQGTVVRIFTVPDARQVCALRRGSRPCHIYCLAFNAHATLLAVSGSTRTVHVFDLEKARLNFQSRMADEYPQQEKSLASKVAFLGRHSFSSLMTKRMHDFVDCDRSFAHARLRSAEPGAGSSRHPTLCALIPSPESSSDILLVVDCGVIFTYVVNHADGGDCRLASASSLLDADEL